MKKEKICIVCPRGCMLNYEYKDGELEITNNGCKRGPIYLSQELVEPKRMLTTTIEVEGGDIPYIPVYSKEYVKKDKVQEYVSFLKKLKLKAPIKCNETILTSINGEDIQILASKTILKKENYE